MFDSMVWMILGAIAVALASARGRLAPALVVAAIPLTYSSMIAGVDEGAIETVQEFFGFLRYLEPISAVLLVGLAFAPDDR